MGKRSDFPRMKGDYYRTPDRNVVKPILQFVPESSTFFEPCAGDGSLIDILESFGLVCNYACDIDPKRWDIVKRDMFDIFLENDDFFSCDFFITNPPWTRKILHPAIRTLVEIKPTWLLFDADWAHTYQAIDLLRFCHKIISVGRVSWMENGKKGKDNVCWYLFDKQQASTQFYGNTKHA